MTKEEKAAYDKEYRRKNSESIKAKKKAYNQTKAGRETQKRARIKRKENGYHNEYCRKPEQREKEKIRRYKRLYGKDYLNITKFCIVCEQTKHFLEFEHCPIYEDDRSHLCKECEEKHRNEYGYKTKNAIQAIIVESKYTLSRQDVAKHPYLIESKKFLILLKQLTK